MELDLDAVADELYGLRQGEFTAARDARAAEARGAGHPQLAAEIKKLKRPTVSAWLANTTARERPEQLGDLLDLGDAMRRAQAGLDGVELARLSRRRHQVVSALRDEARTLAGAAGEPVSAAVERELVSTFEAAIADPVAGAALRSGRLTHALRYSGLGLEGAHVPDRPAGAAGAPPKAGDKVAKGRGRSARGESSAAPDRRRQAAEELRRAEVEDALARRVAGQQAARAEALLSERERVRRQIGDLEAELDRLRAREADVARASEEAEHARRSSATAEGEAGKRVKRARAALDRLGP